MKRVNLNRLWLPVTLCLAACSSGSEPGINQVGAGAQALATFEAADAIVGQTVGDESFPRRLDGAGLSAPQYLTVTTSGHLYVYDSGNYRVLGWASASSFTNGEAATVVLGQRDLLHGNSQGVPESSDFWHNIRFLGTDGSDRLYVGSNYSTIGSHVLVYNDPFTQGVTSDYELSLGLDPVTSVRPFGNGRIAVTGTRGGGPVVLFFNEGASAPIAQQTLLAACAGYGPILDVAKVGDGMLTFCQADIDAVPDGTLDTVYVFSYPLLTSGFPPLSALQKPDTTWPDLAYTLPLEASRFVMGTQSFWMAEPGSHRVVRCDNVATHVSTCNGAAGCTEELESDCDLVYGQPDLTESTPNNRGVNTFGDYPSETTLYAPYDAAVDATGNLYVADLGNHRVLRYNLATGSTKTATAVLGQPDFTHKLTNRQEPDSLAEVRSVALSSTGQAFIVDPDAHRVLVYSNVGALTTGQAPDKVLGQRSDLDDYVNQPPQKLTTETAAAPSQRNLSSPTDAFVDAAGKVYVVDRGNARVLAYDAALTGDATGIAASSFYGAKNFTSAGVLAGTDGGDGDTLPDDLYWDPLAVAVIGNSVFVAASINSGDAFNTVLRFDQANNLPSYVFGQPDLDPAANSVNIPNTCNYPAGQAGADTLCNVTGIAVDAANNRLYVADSGNSRVLWFDNATGNDLATGTADGVIGQPNFSTTMAGFNDTTNALGFSADSTHSAVLDVAFDGTGLWVSDANYNRVTYFATPLEKIPVNFPYEATLPSLVLGQSSLDDTGSNSDGLSARSLSGPTAVAASGSVVMVADTGNNRVLRFTRGSAPLFDAGVGGDYEVVTGGTLTVPVSATDPDGDTVTLSLREPTAAGGSLSGSTFTYSAAGVPAGTVARFTIIATDSSARHETGETSITVRVTPTGIVVNSGGSSNNERALAERPDNCNNCNSGSGILLLPYLLGFALRTLGKRKKQG